MKGQQKNEKVVKATKKLALWTFLWVVTMAVATFGPKFIWNENVVISAVAIFINTAIGGMMIWANIKHLGVLDELQKKIQLEAMGIALGVGIVGGLSYSTTDVANVIQTDAEIGFLVMLISFAYMVSLFIGKRRYS